MVFEINHTSVSVNGIGCCKFLTKSKWGLVKKYCFNIKSYIKCDNWCILQKFESNEDEVFVMEWCYTYVSVLDWVYHDCITLLGIVIHELLT